MGGLLPAAAPSSPGRGPWRVAETLGPWAPAAGMHWGISPLPSEAHSTVSAWGGAWTWLCCRSCFSAPVFKNPKFSSALQQSGGVCGARDEELLIASLAELRSTAAPTLGCREERCSLGSSCVHVAALVFSSLTQTIRAKKTLGPSAIWLSTRLPELVFLTKTVQSSLRRTSSSALR